MQKMWIDGRFTAGNSGKSFEIDNPATEEIIDAVPRGDATDAAAAVEAAAAAFKEWRKVPGLERATLMHQFAARLRALKRRDETRAARLLRARSALFPGGEPQERRLGLAGLVARHGLGVADLVERHLDPWSDGHAVVRL